MADTMKVPVIGETKTVYLYGAGALVAGMAGYAWWKKGKDSPTDFVGASPDDYGVGDYDSPLGDTGTNSTGNYTSVPEGTITTNAQWTQKAVETLDGYGFESSTVLTALAKYLAREGLTEAQITIVQAAIAAVGLPPVGGPYPITAALPPPATVPPPLPPPAPGPPPIPATWEWVVQKGQTLSGIATYFRTTRGWQHSWQDIYNANRSVIGSNPNLIKPGQRLQIPFRNTAW